MTCFHFISFHPLPSGCMCLSCTRISDKVPGKLGGESTGDTRLFQNLPDIMLPEADFAQASRFRTSIQNSPAEVEFLRNRQVTCSECASIQNVHPQISTCHPLIHASMNTIYYWTPPFLDVTRRPGMKLVHWFPYLASNMRHGSQSWTLIMHGII